MVGYCCSCSCFTVRFIFVCLHLVACQSTMHQCQPTWTLVTRRVMRQVLGGTFSRQMPLGKSNGALSSYQKCPTATTLILRNLKSKRHYWSSKVDNSNR